MALARCTQVVAIHINLRTPSFPSFSLPNCQPPCHLLRLLCITPGLCVISNLPISFSNFFSSLISIFSSLSHVLISECDLMWHWFPIPGATTVVTVGRNMKGAKTACSPHIYSKITTCRNYRSMKARRRGGRRHATGIASARDIRVILRAIGQSTREKEREEHDNLPQLAHDGVPAVLKAITDLHTNASQPPFHCRFRLACANITPV